MSGLIIDNFAGGGGASLGIEQALGRPVDLAINHDAEALAMHRANHPETRHLCEDVWDVDPIKETGGKPVRLAWFSPDCKHFSKAKGGKPVNRKIRGLAWLAVKWADQVRPDIIILENVEEFVSWGPLKDGQPVNRERGQTFLLWVKALQKRGYEVDWRELKACDYGAPTIRKRLFVIARRDGEKIVWPLPSHGPDLLPYRTAAECIDWSRPCPSIFTRKRPLAEATMKRIARGIRRFVIDAAEPFIVGTAHGEGQGRGVAEWPLGEPLRTVTGSGDHAVVEPRFAPFIVPITRRGRDAVHPITDPLRTITTSRGGEFTLVSPFFVPRYGEREGQEPRTRSIDLPMPTVVPTANGAQLVAAFMAQHNGGVTGRVMTEPVSTITQTGAQQQIVTSHLSLFRGTSKDGRPVDEPAPTITAQGTHIAEVRAFLLKYYGTAVGQAANKPLHTVTSKERFGLVTIAGVDWQIVDIGMRMLTPRELFRAQGFPDDYRIDPDVDGKTLTKTAQIRMCGNSVPPAFSKALALANTSISRAQELAAAS